MLKYDTNSPLQKNVFPYWQIGYFKPYAFGRVQNSYSKQTDLKLKYLPIQLQKITGVYNRKKQQQITPPCIYDGAFSKNK